MHKHRQYAVAFVFLACIPVFYCTAETGGSLVDGSNNYADLVSLFNEFREFQQPAVTDGVPDYTIAAMEQQKRNLRAYKDRLAELNSAEWPISQQVDYHLVRAEMNKLDFFHRVLKPWARDPIFYLQTQASFGPSRYGALRIRSWPIPDDQLGDVQTKLRAVPVIFEQAKSNLTEGAAGLAFLALRIMDEEINYYSGIVNSLEEHHPDLVPEAELALTAVEEYGNWVQENESTMTAPSGVGIENYNWWIKNVHLLPYTWKEEMDIVMHEDYRMVTSLVLEQNRNRSLPELSPAASQEEYREGIYEAVNHIMKFLSEEAIFTMNDYLTPDGYYRSRIEGKGYGLEKPWPEKQDYFFNFSHREPVMENTHELVGHRFDGLRAQRDNRPIRSMIRRSTIDMIRSEGWAFWLEEMLMHAGYLDTRPRRGREITYEQAVFRTARAVMDLKMHNNEFTVQEAIDYGIENSPQGELLKDSPHLWAITQDNLRYVGWHSGMVVGKFQLNKLIRDFSKQRGDDFNLKEFMDEFLAAGSIPFSLIRWEMTGLNDEVKKLW